MRRRRGGALLLLSWLAARPALLAALAPLASASSAIAAFFHCSIQGSMGRPSTGSSSNTPAKRPHLASTAATASPAPSGGDDDGGAGAKPKGGFLGELYKSPGKRERPLRALFVGHNPSEAAWRAGHYFANPSNRFWHLLRETKMIPATFTCENDADLPHLRGMGFTDLGTGIPGTKSGDFKATVLHSWRASFYQRIKAHAERSGAPPRILAFTGKRQFQELLFDYAKKPAIAFGLQSIRPKGFPFTPEETQLFVLTSSSGAAAMSNEARLAPYAELAALLEAIPWEPED